MSAGDLPPEGERPNATPVRVQLRRSKGWRLPPDTVKVDRSTRWGNPYRIGVHGDAAACIAAYAELLQREPRDLSALRGRNLACWCKPGTPCHADVLLALANAASAAPQGAQR